jgi:hypothetical protein
MRIKQKLVGLVLAVLVGGDLGGRGSAHSQAPSTTTIQAASGLGLVNYQFEGTGASSGASVRLKVKRGPGAPDPLAVSIPPGTILRSSSPGVQSMVVSGVLGVDAGGGMYRPTSQIVLSGESWLTLILSAFCAEFEKDNPSANTTFRVEAPNPMLACIARGSRGLSTSAEQAAVWMHTDKATYKHVNEKFAVTPQEWASAGSVVQACQAAVR